MKTGEPGERKKKLFTELTKGDAQSGRRGRELWGAEAGKKTAMNLYGGEKRREKNSLKIMGILERGENGLTYFGLVTLWAW